MDNKCVGGKGLHCALNSSLYRIDVASVIPNRTLRLAVKARLSANSEIAQFRAQGLEMASILLLVLRIMRTNNNEYPAIPINQYLRFENKRSPTNQPPACYPLFIRS